MIMGQVFVKFKVIKDGECVYEVLPIEHAFHEIPPCEFHGHQLPRQSVESQVIDYLDSIDKTSMMVDMDWDMILDYEPYKETDEVQELFDYLRPCVQMYPSLRKPLESTIYECREILFGCGKDVKQKATETIHMLAVAHKAFTGAADMLFKIIENSISKDDSKLQLGHDRQF